MSWVRRGGHGEMGMGAGLKGGWKGVAFRDDWVQSL